jgi:hypothetical protein
MLKVAVRPFCHNIYAFIPTLSRKGVPYGISETHRITMQECGVTYVSLETDLGPLSKFAPVLEIEKDPSTICLTLDDDVLLHACLIEQLLAKAAEHPDASFSSSGWITGPAPPWSLAFVTEPQRDTWVDVIEGTGVNVFRRGHFGELQDLLNFSAQHPEIGIGHDDHILSAYLAVMEIPRMVVAINRFSCMWLLPENKFGGLSGADGFFEEVLETMQALCRSGHYGRVAYSFVDSLVIGTLLGGAFLFAAVIAFCTRQWCLAALFVVLALVCGRDLLLFWQNYLWELRRPK